METEKTRKLSNSNGDVFSVREVTSDDGKLSGIKISTEGFEVWRNVDLTRLMEFLVQYMSHEYYKGTQQ